MYKFIIIICITTALSSCATTTRWEHPTKKQTGSYLDLLHCKQGANQSAIKSGNLQDKEFIKNEIDECMNEKYGWSKEEEFPLLYYLPFPFNLFFAYR
jgi:hypothetical protein